MPTLFVGNGLIIQYGGEDYLDTNIMSRAEKNARQGNYGVGMRKTLSPQEAYGSFELMKKEIHGVIDGHYDSYAITDGEKSALEDFKSSPPLSVDRVGFEDYFLIFQLVCNKNGIERDLHLIASGAIRQFFLGSIYNNGLIEEVNKKFPIRLIEFLESFDCIFTTNYDANIENVTSKPVYHLHGQFNKLGAPYDPNSFRNMLPDKPANNYDIQDNERHLYCNAVMGYSKDFTLRSYSHVNSFIEKFTEAYNSKPEIRDEVDKWKDVELLPVRNLYEGIKIKSENPEIGFDEYPVREFEGIEGELVIIGFSPYNDRYLMDCLRRNDKLRKINYFYFSDAEAEKYKKYFANKSVSCHRVKDLWESFK